MVVPRGALTFPQRGSLVRRGSYLPGEGHGPQARRRPAPPTANTVRRSRPEGGGLRPVYRGFPGACGDRLDFCDFKR